jgi:hypothetical protein
MLPVWIAGVAVLAGLAALGLGSGVRLLIVAGCAVIFLAGTRRSDDPLRESPRSEFMI